MPPRSHFTTNYSLNRPPAAGDPAESSGAPGLPRRHRLHVPTLQGGEPRSGPREGTHTSPRMSKHPQTILGLDPGTRFLGVAVVRGDQLLAYGVHELKNGQRPYDVIGQARRVVFGYIAQHAPAVVAIERPYRIATPRAAVLTTLAAELRERAKELGLEVVERSPEEVRLAITGNKRATKYEVAQKLGERFPELAALVPKKPQPAVLWLKSRERYWLHMFDALALTMAAISEQTLASHDQAP